MARYSYGVLGQSSLDLYEQGWIGSQVDALISERSGHPLLLLAHLARI